MFSSSSPRSGLAAAVGYASDAGAAPRRILVCDPTSKGRLISRLVTASAAEVVLVDSLDHSPSPLTSYSVVLIALAEPPNPTAPILNTFRLLSEAAIPVLCYGEGMLNWPLATRCNMLVAGVSAIFDSGPAFLQELQETVIEILRLQNCRLEEEQRLQNRFQPLGIIGESRTMRAIFKWIEGAATLSDLPICITGETGTGKELLVSAIHSLDPKRSSGPLVALNCGAITPGVAESELFGHRRGSFTGADRDRRGLIRTAETGILFLDEIGDLDLGLQTKLLRVLQENRVLAVGEDREAPIDVRVIAATNRDLEAMVAAGQFRDDLFHRLNILSIHIPPLRQRRADVEPLVRHFVGKYEKLLGDQKISIGKDFLEALGELELTGNARELENLVRRALVHRRSSTSLSLADIPSQVLGKLAQRSAPPNEISQTDQSDHPSRVDLDDYDLPLSRLLQLHHGNLADTLNHCERSLISTTLRQSKGNQSLAARLLGITPRSIYNKLRKHRLS